MTPLEPDEVHVWRVHLDVPPAASAALYAHLSSDEMERRARLRLARDRRRFAVSRGSLRDLLGRYVEVDPGEIRFVYGARGKPALDPVFYSRIRFNLSHSEDLALIAVVLDAEVGVDVERVRRQPDFTDLAKSHLSAVEAGEMEKLSGELRARAFFTGWTRHEAYAKACGAGLGGETTDAALAQGWSVYGIEPAPGYLAALAIEGIGWRLTMQEPYLPHS